MASGCLTLYSTFPLEEKLSIIGSGNPWIEAGAVYMVPLLN